MPQRTPAAERENLAGLVERVTFHNEDSGFCVLRVKARGQRDLVTIVGHAAAIGAGKFVQASGRWINDRMMNNSIFGTMGGALSRLSIVNGDGWRQPLANEDAAIFVVCGGKIYIHRSLKSLMNTRSSIRTMRGAARIHSPDDR
jgi:hypothetical protein